MVQELQVTTPRSVIRPADPIMFIIPQDRPLVVVARVATINVDEVDIPAQQVGACASASFSSRTTPEIDGVLEPESFTRTLVDQATQVPDYRAEVTIPATELEKLKGLYLVPGMPVEVYIQTGERHPDGLSGQTAQRLLIRAFRENWYPTKRGAARTAPLLSCRNIPGGRAIRATGAAPGLDPQTPAHDRLLGVQAVLGLVEDDRIAGRPSPRWSPRHRDAPAGNA